MDSLSEEVIPVGNLRSQTSHRLAAVEALEFLDPELARAERGVDLVRILLDPEYETEPVVVAHESPLVQRIIYHHLLPQLSRAVDEGKIGVSDGMRASIEGSATGSAIRTLALERLAVQVTEILGPLGIEFLVLKGVATGRLDHGDPMRRETSDLDILVRRDRFQHAVDALSESGFTQRSDPDLLDKGESWESPAGVVDLHVRPHAAGRFLDEHWWETSEPLPIAGHELRALSRAGRMAHAASHYSLSYPNHRMMTSLLDLLAIARVANDAERAEAGRFLSGVGVSDIAARITRRAAALLGDESVFVGGFRSRPLDRLLRRAYDRPDLNNGAIKLAKTFGMPWNEKVGAVRRLVAPTDEYLAKGGYTSRTDRFVTLIRRRRNRSVLNGPSGDTE